ncbi:MAG TPA: vanadium-dependent haloperoxidase [Gemmatimonadaceae bacterium]|nr:vanadium-dependent haloperoxidase [Gemmatimonadaceae bacterium]
MRIKRVLIVSVAATALAGCARDSGDYRTRAADPEMLHTAVSQLTDVIVYDIFSPPQASRVYAYASVAAYEALRNGHAGEYRSLAGQLNGLTPPPVPTPDSEYYLPLSGVHAFMVVAKALTFSQARMDSLRAAMDQRYAQMGIPEPVYKRSIAYGDTVAKHILAWAKKDNYLQTRGMPKYTVTSAAGTWVPTPPAYMDAVEPNWSKVRPFVMDSASQFRPAAPLPIDTARASPYFRQVMEVYDVRKTITDDQRDLTAFWDCNPYVMHVQGHAMFATKKVTPGGHWMGIAGIAAEKSKADIMASAEAYVRTAVALADGFISSWDMKYSTNMIRPETVINKYLDESWEPLLQTPPFPEYTSGHSVISTAAAIVLTEKFGPAFSFTDSTEKSYGLPVRSFPSFNAAAAEAAISRLYGGIHYRRSIEEGAKEGRKVGELVLARIQTRTGAVAGTRQRAQQRVASAPRQ